MKSIINRFAFFVFILAPTLIFSQNSQWVFGLPGNQSADVAYDIEVDSLGNSYVGGNFQGTIDFNPGAGVASLTATGGGWDIFLAKYDANGNYLWAFKIPGVGGNDVINHIAIDSKGDCYVTGWFAGTNVDFDPGAGIANLSCAGSNDIFVAKYSANGIYQWAHRIGGSSMDAGNGIAADGSGNCFVTGNFAGTNIDFDPGSGVANLSASGSNDAFVVKYSTTGIYQWAFAIGGSSNDLGWGVALDVNSNVYVTGQFSGSNVDFDPAAGVAALTSAGSSDIYIAKYTSAGNYLWAGKAGGSSGDIGFAIAVDINGNAYISGTFQGTNADFDPGATSAVLASLGSDDIFVAKYNTSGAYSWAFKIGGSGSDNSWYKSTDISLDCTGNVYVAGGFASTNVDFDPGTGSAVLSSAGSKDIFCAQYTTNGNYLCAFKVGQSSEDDAYGIAVSQNGCHIAGRFQGNNMDFNPGAGTANLTSSVWSDIFVGKYDMCQPPVLNFANITGQQDVCAGQSLTLSATGGGTYLWHNSTTTSTVSVTPVTATTYSVIVTTGRFCRDTAYAPVNVFPAAALTISPATSVCSGKSTTLTVGGANTYTWSPALGLNTTNGSSVISVPTANTTYTVTGIDANGCTATGVTTITINPVPTLSVTGNNSMCSGFSNVLSVIGASSYVWSPATGLNTNTGWIVTASPSATITYSVTGTDNNGCTNTVSTVLTVNSKPVMSISTPITICAGNTATLSAGGANVYNWQPSAATGNVISVNPSSTTTYTVIGTDINGCNDTLTTSVNLNQLPVINATQGIAACIGTTVVLSAGGALAYNWQPVNTNSPTLSVSPSATTTYTVTGIDINGCSNSITTTLTINPLPVIGVSSNTIICNGSSTVLTASGASSYSWLPVSSLNTANGSSVIASPGTAITYTVTGTDNNGCSNTAAVNIALNIPLAGLVSQDTAVCLGNAAGLSAIAAGGGTGYFYNWQPGNFSSASINVLPTATTTYTVTITDNCGSTPYTEEVMVMVNSLPVVSFTSDVVSGCGPLCVNFSNTTPNTLNALWNFGNGSVSNLSSPENCYTQTGSYNVSLTVTDGNGCSDSLLITNYITVFPDPVAGFSYSPSEITILSADVKFTDESVDATDWLWSFGDATDNTSIEQNPSFTYSDTGSYKVQQIVINEFGCRDTAEEIIRIKPDYVLYVPNTFTPNGDLHNEIFIPLGIGVDAEKYDFYIFDRWGDLIFHTDDVSEGWDGRSNGGTQLSQQDTYVWKLELKDVLGERHQYIGHVNLIR